jgi:hypothetical protein
MKAKKSERSSLNVFGDSKDREVEDTRKRRQEK